jgi:hypothetical protein
MTVLAPARVLVDGPMAAAWTGRPQSTLRRWVHEGRIRRYGRGLYDLAELPERRAGGVPARRHACDHDSSDPTPTVRERDARRGAPG